jgi:hypothetical protein
MTTPRCNTCQASPIQRRCVICAGEPENGTSVEVLVRGRVEVDRAVERARRARQRVQSVFVIPPRALRRR